MAYSSNSFDTCQLDSRESVALDIYLMAGKLTTRELSKIYSFLSVSNFSVPKKRVKLPHSTTKHTGTKAMGNAKPVR